jgi:hypothetical protein
MHGTFIDSKKNKVRNNIKLYIQTTAGDYLLDPKLYDAARHGTGCRIKVVMSVVTPLTSHFYQFERHV